MTSDRSSKKTKKQTNNNQGSPLWGGWKPHAQWKPLGGGGAMAKPKYQTWANFSPRWKRTAKQKKLFAANCPTLSNTGTFTKGNETLQVRRPFSSFLFFKLHRLRQTGDKLSLPENWNLSRRCDQSVSADASAIHSSVRELSIGGLARELWWGSYFQTRVTCYFRLSKLRSDTAGLLPFPFKNQNKTWGAFSAGRLGHLGIEKKLETSGS